MGQMVKTAQRDCLIDLSLQHPCLSLAEIFVRIYKWIGQKQEMVMFVFHHSQI